VGNYGLKLGTLLLRKRLLCLSKHVSLDVVMLNPEAEVWLTSAPRRSTPHVLLNFTLHCKCNHSLLVFESKHRTQIGAQYGVLLLVKYDVSRSVCLRWQGQS
jgi:hypothetical protein